MEIGQKNAKMILSYTSVQLSYLDRPLFARCGKILYRLEQVVTKFADRSTLDVHYSSTKKARIFSSREVLALNMGYRTVY